MREARFRQIALSLPAAEERETWGEATFRVRNKIFAMMGSDGRWASIKATHEEQQALIEGDPDAFYLPGYVAQHGWVGVRLARAKGDEVAELLTEAWRMTALKRAVRAFDEGRD
jgi:hypothetical protein